MVNTIVIFLIMVLVRTDHFRLIMMAMKEVLMFTGLEENLLTFMLPLILGLTSL